MFYELSNIIKIDLSYFNTSLVTNMYRMFKNCSSLISLNLNNFNTSLVTDMRSMFNGCISLISLNLNNFNTSLVTNMRSMFYKCNSLISLNLNNFNTSLVTDMSYMFYKCSSLISLNLNYFDTSLVTNMYGMFYGCHSLISLNLHNFNTSIVTNISNIFDGCNSSLIYCINEKIENKLSPLLSNVSNDCNNICFVNLDRGLMKGKRKCVNNCLDDDQYKYEYNNICYEICPNGTHNTNTSKNNYLCKLDDDIDCDIKCKDCNLKSNIYNLCISCNIQNIMIIQIMIHLLIVIIIH